MFFQGIEYRGSSTKTLLEHISWYCDLDINAIWQLLNRTANDIARHFDIIALVLMIMVAISIIIGIAILRNQKQIKKQLRQLLEQKEVTSSGDQTTIDKDDETP